MLRVGDRVQFKQEYDGYFKLEKNKIFTVAKVYPRDRDTSGETLQLAEIEIAHLLLQTNFKKVEDLNE